MSLSRIGLDYGIINAIDSDNEDNNNEEGRGGRQILVEDGND